MKMNMSSRSSRNYILLVAGALAAALTVTADAGAAPSGPGPAWATLASVPTPVEGMSVAGVGNQIIAACGFAGGDTATTRIYNIASDTWSFGAPAPGTNSESAGTSHGGLFYSLGGRVSGPGSLARDDLWAYDRTTDLWTVLAPMLTARAGLGIAVQDNTIYAIGGRTGTGGPGTGGVLATVEAYDIDTDTWTAVAPLLSARSDLAAATVGGKIYVFGGIDAAGTFLDDVDVYDPITNAWSTAPADMPMDVGTAAHAHAAGRSRRRRPWRKDLHRGRLPAGVWRLRRRQRGLQALVHLGNGGGSGFSLPLPVFAREGRERSVSALHPPFRLVTSATLCVP